ncbi:glycosyltransferase family 2 protein, partial [Mesonia mobilis]|uniref:glycosyltransferase family 2 protein n=1 Tax=Mesonia mobilis TaxID=369791 RepID=UPI0032164B87
SNSDSENFLFMKISLLITTYNWPEALELVLKSIQKQSLMPFEVLIADDGSDVKTKNVIDNFKRESVLDVKHIWHEDKGFRRTYILNKAIAKSSGDYIIQLDGDCILHSKFIEDHKRLSQKKTYLFGSRVNIKEEFLSKLFSDKNTKFSFFSKAISKRTRNLHLRLFSNRYKAISKLSNKLRGCNISYWKKDIIAVNGYNEDMTGWGKEDSEMAVRLINNGILGKRLRYSGIIYHIWHKENSRSSYNKNNEIEKFAIDNNLKWCKNGIDKYLN